jgi:hypothetical protein
MHLACVEATKAPYIKPINVSCNCCNCCSAGLITWFIARDIHTAAAVSRNFFWTDVNLWPDEIPSSSLFVLSEQVSQQVDCAATVNAVLLRHKDPL